MVLSKMWEKTGSMHEGIRLWKGKGRVISKYCWYGSDLLLR